MFLEVYTGVPKRGFHGTSFPSKYLIRAYFYRIKNFWENHIIFGFQFEETLKTGKMDKQWN